MSKQGQSMIGVHQFLTLLDQVSAESWNQEPKCLCYCWLPSRQEGDLTVQGVELYAEEQALVVAHRSGAAYQQFREALRNERLAPPPTANDLRFWRPTQENPKTNLGLLSSLRKDSKTLTFLITRYQLADQKSQENLLDKVQGSDLGGEDSEGPAVNIVATTEGLYDVVKLQIWSNINDATIEKAKAIETERQVLGAVASCLSAV
ncbi:hypothetical protein LTR99_008381 [Exophiala xenobiotica]|uniref:Uncharacterized protein n=1 Tax=Vermiconidia calcicola TaxID=1690605 RepID=A0AAV9Q3U9_9PEZI|nr:hypothetical protein LTR92_008469 [Exophiala xenobiotica]KAK5531153.1 hypothetical protein LTR23_010067 [Chaetothyriales sp. CCFEE 6169]KAK5532771.1 hypothetical protein LTR25_007475 [Vermiconidia calcicola]KAK5218539.1 hypothetical protein LTR72_008478 [Exophiala xenobiotica]KAK5233556.1 hypothetical protein LTR47_005178 [Exophiala xenobiotica]